jgi:hypothetical protein
MIKRDRFGPTSVRFELDFAPTGVPGGPFQMRNEQAADAAPSTGRIDQEPMNNRHARRPAFPDGQRYGAS